MIVWSVAALSAVVASHETHVAVEGLKCGQCDRGPELNYFYLMLINLIQPPVVSGFLMGHTALDSGTFKNNVLLSFLKHFGALNAYQAPCLFFSVKSDVTTIY